MNNMSFKTYAIYSYVIGFVWTLVYFVLGSIFGKHIEMIATLVTEYGIYFGGIVIIVSSISYVYMHKKNTVVSEIK
ncbi:alkaline phosphatase, partial [Bacillus thuringiensis]